MSVLSFNELHSMIFLNGEWFQKVPDHKAAYTQLVHYNYKLLIKDEEVE